MKYRTSTGLAIFVAFATVACGGGDEDSQQQQDPASDRQPPAQEQMPSQQQGQQAEVTNEELRTFVQAQNQLRTAQQELQGQMNEALSAQDSQQVRDDAKRRFDEILSEVGLTMERYQQIAKAIKTDRSLLKQYMTIQKQMESGSSR